MIIVLSLEFSMIASLTESLEIFPKLSKDKHNIIIVNFFAVNSYGILNPWYLL